MYGRQNDLMKVRAHQGSTLRRGRTVSYVLTHYLVVDGTTEHSPRTPLALYFPSGQAPIRPWLDRVATPGRTNNLGTANSTLTAHTLLAYHLPMGTLWTVVETPSYLSRAEKIFSASERAEIVTMLASDPECGEIIPGTGDVRKVRVAVGGRGKSGGARVIYYFHGSESLPILIFAVFTKNEKANLSDTEKNNLAKLTQAIKARAK